MDEKKNSKLIYAIIGGIVGSIIAILCVGILIFCIYKFGIDKKDNKNSNITTTNNSSLLDYETEHVIDDLKIKFVPTQDMLILNDSEIDQFMGQGYSDLYEIISMNETGDKLLYVFKIKEDEANNNTADEYIEKSMQNSEHDSIEKENICGIEFSKTNVVREEDGKKFNEACYVYKYDKTFLCIDYWYLSDLENNLPQMFQSVE